MSLENPRSVEYLNSLIVIENPKGTYKSFEIEGDPLWEKYPLAGVTYPVDYGYIGGYESEDGHDLDVFKGSGDRHGFMKIWRYDVPIETKFAINVTQEEWQEILEIFKPVITESGLFETDDDLLNKLDEFAAH